METREEKLVAYIADLLRKEFNDWTELDILSDLPRLARIGIQLLNGVEYANMTGMDKKAVLTAALVELCPNDSIDAWIPSVIDTLVPLLRSADPVVRSHCESCVIL